MNVNGGIFGKFLFFRNKQTPEGEHVRILLKPETIFNSAPNLMDTETGNMLPTTIRLNCPHCHSDLTVTIQDHANAR